MAKLVDADCLRIVLWFVGEEHFIPSQRMLIELPFGEDAVRAALAELRQLQGHTAVSSGCTIPGFAKPDLVRALRAIRRFCVPELIFGRILSLLRDISDLSATVPLHDSLFSLLQTPDMFRDRRAWLALKAAMEQCLALGHGEKVRKILIRIGTATSVLQSWYDLQEQLRHPPIAPSELPLVWKVDRKRLPRLQSAIDTYGHCAGHLLPKADLAVLDESRVTLAKLDFSRPHWDNLRSAIAGCLQMLMAANPPRDQHGAETKLDCIRALFERADTHLGHFSVPQTDGDIKTAFDILNEIHAELNGFLAEDDTECSTAITAQLENCLKIIEQFLCSMPPTSPLPAIEHRLNRARTNAPGRLSTEVCDLVAQLRQAYQELIEACREHLVEEAWTAADTVETLIEEIRESPSGNELYDLCDSIERLLYPLAEYQETCDRLTELDPPPRAVVVDDLNDCLGSLMQWLRRTTDAKIARVECRISQLLPLALHLDSLECLAAALGEFREAASRDVVDALRNHADDICDWSAVYRPAFDAARFYPPTGDDLCEVREALAALRPGKIVKRLETTHPDRPFPEHTLRLMERLAEYEAGLTALGTFLPEYTKVVGFLESTDKTADGLGEFERFRYWLYRQPFRFPAPRLSPLPYADFLAWLVALPVSQQADVLRVMFIGPWSEAIDGRAKQLIEDRPSMFNVADGQRVNEAAKRRALLFLIHALSICRPFGLIRKLWETICPLHYRRILLPGPTMLEHMLRAVEKGIAAWQSAQEAGTPGMPDTYPIEMAIALAWNYLLGDERLAKQLAEGKLRSQSQRVIAASFLLESAFAGPATQILDSLCEDPYQELENSLQRQLPRIEGFYGGGRRAEWARDLIDDIMGDINHASENSQKKAMSAQERRKKRAASRRRHSRIRAEEEILVAKIRGLLGRLREALPEAEDSAPGLWAHYRMLRGTLCLYRWREKTISRLRRKQKEHSSEAPLPEIQVLEQRIEKSYANLYGLAHEISASYRRVRDEAHSADLPGLEECLERTGRATVDLVYGFVRGRQPRYPGDDRRGSNLDSRPRGLQYLILRKAVAGDDVLLEELLEPPC